MFLLKAFRCTLNCYIFPGRWRKEEGLFQGFYLLFRSWTPVNLVIPLNPLLRKMSGLTLSRPVSFLLLASGSMWVWNCQTFWFFKTSLEIEIFVCSFLFFKKPRNQINNLSHCGHCGFQVVINPSFSLGSLSFLWFICLVWLRFLMWETFLVILGYPWLKIQCEWVGFSCRWWMVSIYGCFSFPEKNGPVSQGRQEWGGVWRETGRENVCLSIVGCYCYGSSRFSM